MKVVYKKPRNIAQQCATKSIALRWKWKPRLIHVSQRSETFLAWLAVKSQTGCMLRDIQQIDLLWDLPSFQWRIWSWLETVHKHPQLEICRAEFSRGLNGWSVEKVENYIFSFKLIVWSALFNCFIHIIFASLYISLVHSMAHNNLPLLNINELAWKLETQMDRDWY